MTTRTSSGGWWGGEVRGHFQSYALKVKKNCYYYDVTSIVSLTTASALVLQYHYFDHYIKATEARIQ